MEMLREVLHHRGQEGRQVDLLRAVDLAKDMHP